MTTIFKSKKYEYRAVTAVPDAYGERYQVESRALDSDVEWKRMGLPVQTKLAAKNTILQHIATDNFTPTEVEL